MMAGATSQLFQGFTSIEPFENVKASSREARFQH
jgi:hypothetical protein